MIIRKKKLKNAQLGMMETIAVLIVFVLLMIIGLGMYFSFKSKGIKEQTTKIQEMRWTETLTVVQTLPEIQCNSKLCGSCAASEQGYSYDLEKILAAREVIGSHMTYYVPILKSSLISFEIIDPRFSFDEDMYDDLDQDIIDTKVINLYNMSLGTETNQMGFYLPVNIYDPVGDRCLMGVMNINLYFSAVD